MKRPVAIITGASRGIGRRTAERCAEAFAHVICVGRDEAALDVVCRGIGERAIAHTCDVRAEDAVRTLFERVKAEFGAADLVVNNAAVMVSGPVRAMSADDFDAITATNLRGPFLVMRECLPLLDGQPGATIVNVASLAPTAANPTLGAYAASKAGLIALSDALREEVRESGVRVAVVLPGSTATSLHPVSDVRDEDWMLDPDDVAEAIVSIYQAPTRALISRVELRPVRRRPRRHPPRR